MLESQSFKMWGEMTKDEQVPQEIWASRCKVPFTSVKKSRSNQRTVSISGQCEEKTEIHKTTGPGAPAKFHSDVSVNSQMTPTHTGSHFKQVSLLVKGSTTHRQHLSATAGSGLYHTKLDARINRAPRIRMYCSTKRKPNASTRRIFVQTQDGHMLNTRWRVSSRSVT